ARRQDRREPGRRTSFVEGHVHAVGLVDAEQRDDRRRTDGTEPADAAASLATLIFEKPRELVRLRLERFVLQYVAVHHDCAGVGPSKRLPGDEILDQHQALTSVDTWLNTRAMWPISAESGGVSRMNVWNPARTYAESASTTSSWLPTRYGH